MSPSLIIIVRYRCRLQQEGQLRMLCYSEKKDWFSIVSFIISHFCFFVASSIADWMISNHPVRLLIGWSLPLSRLPPSPSFLCSPARASTAISTSPRCSLPPSLPPSFPPSLPPSFVLSTNNWVSISLARSLSSHPQGRLQHPAHRSGGLSLAHWLSLSQAGIATTEAICSCLEGLSSGQPEAGCRRKPCGWRGIVRDDGRGQWWRGWSRGGNADAVVIGPKNANTSCLYWSVLVLQYVHNTQRILIQYKKSVFNTFTTYWLVLVCIRLYSFVLSSIRSMYWSVLNFSI